MANIEVQNSGWNSINDQEGAMGEVGSILSKIPNRYTKAIGGAMNTLDSAHKGNGEGLLKTVVSSVVGKPGGDEASFGNELSEAQGMFGSKNMNVGKTPTLGGMH